MASITSGKMSFYISCGEAEGCLRCRIGDEDEKFKNQNEVIGNIYDYYHPVLRNGSICNLWIEGKRSEIFRIL